MKGWDWSRRLAEVNVQRLQFPQTVTRDEFEEFLIEIMARLTLRAVDTSTARHMRSSAIRYGTVGVRGEDPLKEEAVTPTAKLELTLGEEAETVRWMHTELESGHTLPLQEAETVVRALSVAMHADQQMVLPLLRLREFDEYTTTHSLNVAVLAMGLAEWLGLGARNVRAFGLAGLLHDLGKVKIPKEVLTKPGKLTPEERELMNAHPTEGARIIISTEKDMDLAAVVAYEHHVMLNAGGYPTFKYPRDCHEASRLVHVCDVYDALRTKRPYREAWASEKVVEYIDERAGTEFDVGMARAFTQMMREREAKVAIDQ
jgi:putative nucleotidyltransferase with HDIG domain